MPYRHLGEDSSRKNRRLKALAKKRQVCLRTSKEASVTAAKRLRQGRGRGRDEVRKALRVQHL